MLAYIKRFWHKFLCVLCAVIVALSTVLYAVAPTVYAVGVGEVLTALEISNYIAELTGLKSQCKKLLDDTVKLIKNNRVNAQYNYISFWKLFVSQCEGMTEERFRSFWQAVLDNDSISTGIVIDDDTLDIFYDTIRSGLGLDILTPLIFDTSESSPHFNDDGDVQISAEDFRKMCEALEEQYAPKNTSNRHSWQTDKAYNTHLSFFSEGTFFNSGLSDVYCVPFFYNGKTKDTYYYSLCQLHFYQQVTQDENGNNVVSLYMDYYNWFDKGETTTYLVSSDLATIRYMRFPDITNSTLTFRGFTKYSDFLTYSNGSYMQIAGVSIDPSYDLSDLSLNTSVRWQATLPWAIRYTTNSAADIAAQDYADYGFFYSNEPINMGAYDDIDFKRIPDNYYITINGDTVYDYPITNPDTGKSTTINNYITNNYYIGDDDSSGGGGTINNWNIEFGDFIANIRTSIETAITNVFVADVDVINGYNEEIKGAFEDKLPFVSDFKEIFQSLFVDIVDNNFVYAGDIKPEGAKDEDGNLREEDILYPSWGFTIDFFGQKLELTILDFSMYAEPLYYVRIVVCVFIYVVYFVNLAKSLPKLLGNVLDVTDSVSSAVKGGDEK